MDSGLCLHVAQSTSYYCMSSDPPARPAPPPLTAAPCCFSSAMYECVFLFIVLLLLLYCFAFSLSVVLSASFCLYRSRYLPVFLSITFFPSTPLRLLRDRLFIRACGVSFRYLCFLFFFFFLFCQGTYLRFSLLLFCVPFLTSSSPPPPPPPPPSPLFLFHPLAGSISFFLSLLRTPTPLFSLATLAPPPLLCPPTYTPSLAHDLLPPPFPTSPCTPFCPFPPPLSPAPGCQTLPSRPRGKAKAVDFSPHQAF